MSPFPRVLLILLSLPVGGADPAQLREALHDRQDPRGQSQAALLLVRDRSADAEEIVRAGLHQTSAPDVFLALASAVRLNRDSRFGAELLTALARVPEGPRSPVRQAAAEALAAVADAGVIGKLGKLLDAEKDSGLRESVLWILGHCGKKEAVPVLLAQLATEQEPLHRAAVEGLTELTGLSYGSNQERWAEWWQAHKNLSAQGWLELRLAYQTSRSRRLEGELSRARAQLVGLHQQVYGRLPAAERLGYIQTAATSDDPAVRLLAVNWAVDMLSRRAGGLGPAPGQEWLAQHTLSEVLLRLSHDNAPEVQRQAILGLGRVRAERAFERLRSAVQKGQTSVRAAAARALAQQAQQPQGNGAKTEARRKQVVAILQKALDDCALEVVVEAAEELGALGVPEAGPVLTGLLRHTSVNARQAAAHALERVADAGVLDDLLAALDDRAVAVRFSLIGAVSHAASGKKPLSEAQRQKTLNRLREVLLKDTDPGVRSRAATVLGECGQASVLPALWGRVAANEDNRVQAKAWTAMVEILARLASAELLREWDARLARESQPARRLRLLLEVHDRWQKRPEARALFVPAAELLAQAHIEQGKWMTAEPLLCEMLSRVVDAAGCEHALRLLLTCARQAQQAGNTAAARRLIGEARPYLSRGSKLAEEFDRLEMSLPRK
jgi:HEAT repeat protein